MAVIRSFVLLLSIILTAASPVPKARDTELDRIDWMVNCSRPQPPIETSQGVYEIQDALLPDLLPRNFETCVFNGKTYDCDNKLPTLENIMMNLRNPGVITNLASLPAYYTGWSKSSRDELGFHMTSWINSSPSGSIRSWYWFYNMVPNAWYDAQIAWIEKHIPFIFDKEATKVFIGCLSEAMAVMCVHHEVVLFAPDDYVIGSEPRRIWWTVEFPQLTQNPVVQTIWRVDPMPPEKGGNPCGGRIIWQRGKDEPVEPLWYCPIRDGRDSP